MVATTNNDKMFKPKASYTFTLKEKRHICEWVKNLKMSYGYVSNLTKCADMDEGKLSRFRGNINSYCIFVSFVKEYRKSSQR